MLLKSWLNPQDDTVVLKIDGSSEIRLSAHMLIEIGNLIYLRHLFRSAAVPNLELFSTEACFPQHWRHEF